MRYNYFIIKKIKKENHLYRFVNWLINVEPYSFDDMAVIRLMWAKRLMSQEEEEI